MQKAGQACCFYSKSKEWVSEGHSSWVIDLWSHVLPPVTGILPPADCHTFFREHRLPLGLGFPFRILTTFSLRFYFLLCLLYKIWDPENMKTNIGTQAPGNPRYLSSFAGPQEPPCSQLIMHLGSGTAQGCGILGWCFLEIPTQLSYLRSPHSFRASGEEAAGFFPLNLFFFYLLSS